MSRSGEIHLSVVTYGGASWTHPNSIEVDHVVALKEAWGSGAHTWKPEARAAFANDLTDARTLRAVTAGVNAQKADKDPSNWLPPLESDVCSFAVDWIASKPAGACR